MTHFDDGAFASRRDKLLYYGERVVAWTVGTMAVLGLFLLFWDGWVQGHARYWEAMKTADICDQHRDSIMDSNHLRSTCKDVGIEKGTYPVVYAMQYTLVAVLDWTISTVCHIGASWITSGFMGVVFALSAAYVYRRITGPPNPYALSAFHHHHPLVFHSEGCDLALRRPQAMIEYGAGRFPESAGGYFYGVPSSSRGPQISEVYSLNKKAT